MSDNDRHHRLKRWQQQDPAILTRVSDSYYADLEAAIIESGKKDWRDEQIHVLGIASKPKIPTQYNRYIRLGAAFIGAVTFSVAPTWLARQTGRGIWAESMGLVGGGVAGYVVHDLAAKAILGYTLKQRYRRNRKLLKDSIEGGED
jgi:hypothetical protein